MNKSPKAFRLSGQAIEALKWLVAQTGANETAIVEMALVHFRKQYQVEGVSGVVKLEGEDKRVESNQELSLAKAKKRRRRR
jgi:hypothetical protein